MNQNKYESPLSSRYASQEKKALDCIGCGACEQRCPYQLPIRKMLRKVAEHFGE